MTDRQRVWAARDILRGAAHQHQSDGVESDMLTSASTCGDGVGCDMTRRVRIGRGNMVWRKRARVGVWHHVHQGISQKTW